MKFEKWLQFAVLYGFDSDNEIQVASCRCLLQRKPF